MLICFQARHAIHTRATARLSPGTVAWGQHAVGMGSACDRHVVSMWSAQPQPWGCVMWQMHVLYTCSCSRVATPILLNCGGRCGGAMWDNVE